MESGIFDDGGGLNGGQQAVFFSAAVPSLPARIPVPWSDEDSCLDDLLGLADLLFQRLAPTRALAASPPLPALPEVEAAARQQLVMLEERLRASRTNLAERAAATAEVGLEPPLSRLRTRFAMDDAAVEIVVLLLAVELDPRRLAATVPADATLVPAHLTPAALRELLAPEESSHRWVRRFIGAGSLVDRRLVLRLDPRGPLAAAALQLNPALLGELLGQNVHDPLLDGLVELGTAGDPHILGPEHEPLLHALAGDTVSGASGHSLWLIGGARQGTQSLARALATAAGRPFVEVDLAALAHSEPATSPATMRALRLEQQLRRAVLLLAWPGSLEPMQRGAALAWLRELQRHAVAPILVVSEHTDADLVHVLGSALTHALPAVQGEARQTLWRTSLQRVGVSLPDDRLVRLAEDFALGPHEIDELITGLSSGGATLDEESLRQASAQRMRGRLGRLAERLITPFSWNDLILPEEELARLKEMVIYERYRRQVFLDWDMVSKLPYGGGIAALFYGPPGTGKTMAASVVANALGRELHRVDLSRVVDKYIGETEKNLAAVFDGALESHAVLLFDEADSLFARRTAVASSNDRYANLETNFLLQRIEAHPGITILTTNQLKAIDEAFLRRISFKVEFPFPDATARAYIWGESIPQDMPIAADIDPEALGDQFELSGGHIRAAVLRSAFAAAAAGEPVDQAKLCQAARTEYEGLGKLIHE